jgi:hypothetical protein
MARIVTYECEQCGTEVVVTENLETDLRPIYCCGIEVAEISVEEEKRGAGKKAPKKAVRKPAAKAVKRGIKTAAKKITPAGKPAAAKKTASAKKTTAKKKTSRK